MARNRRAPSLPDEATPRAEPGDSLAPAIERMKQIAAQSGDSLLQATGEPHPDADLLDLAADAMHLRKVEAQAFQNRMDGWTPNYRATAAEKLQNETLRAEEQAADQAFKNALRRAAKLPAKTGAGLFAKAMLVSASKTGAATLAKSLADDLLSSPALRATLWPATQEAAR